MTAGSRAVSNPTLRRAKPVRFLNKIKSQPNASLEESDYIFYFGIFDVGSGAELVKPFIHITEPREKVMVIFCVKGT